MVILSGFCNTSWVSPATLTVVTLPILLGRLLFFLKLSLICKPRVCTLSVLTPIKAEEISRTGELRSTLTILFVGYGFFTPVNLGGAIYISLLLSATEGSNTYERLCPLADNSICCAKYSHS